MTQKKFCAELRKKRSKRFGSKRLGYLGLKEGVWSGVETRAKHTL